MGQAIQDPHGRPVEVGTRVIFGTDQPGVVTAISDVDGDFDDELGRGVMINPRVTVALDAGGTDESTTSDTTKVTWNDYPDGPETYVFEADDLVVAG